MHMSEFEADIDTDTDTCKSKQIRSLPLQRPKGMATAAPAIKELKRTDQVSRDLDQWKKDRTDWERQTRNARAKRMEKNEKEYKERGERPPTQEETKAKVAEARQKRKLNKATASRIHQKRKIEKAKGDALFAEELAVYNQSIEDAVGVVPNLKAGIRPNVRAAAKATLASVFPETDETGHDSGGDSDCSVRELAKLRYVPKNVARSTVAYYEGIKLKGRTSKKVDILNPSWVKDKFTPKFVEFLQLAASRRNTKNSWIDVPVGAPLANIASTQSLDLSIHVQYTQNNHSTCLFKGCASAFHFHGMRLLASTISSTAGKYTDKPSHEQLEHLVSIVKQAQPKTRVQKWFKKTKAMTLDVLADKSSNVTVVIPLGKDGGVQHAVTILDDHIFDSTQAYAMHLTKESLDWCCNNSQGYRRVYMAVRFTMPKSPPAKF